ncbi:MAG: terminase small subunit, partial [Methyloceanibacter sp.]
RHLMSAVKPKRTWTSPDSPSPKFGYIAPSTGRPAAMGILANPRHERFVQALFEGETADAAYAKAGYKPNDGNCIRLKGNERVKARLAELQAQAAKKSEVTVQSLLDELEAARARADSLDQLSSVVKAISEKAKISGLLVRRVEVGNPGDFSDCESFADIADQMIADLIEKFRPVDERDRQGLIELIERQAQETREYLDAISARPITAERVNAADLTTPWQQLQPHSAPTRLPPRGNGIRR